ncbi:MAG: beta-galactosidase [Bacteroidetes bacterium]|nr:beta-galactosidase [Bacteroidota bacterium]MCL5024976.1 beta-galactosidase [Chloroflexota bacterium]
MILLAVLAAGAAGALWGAAFRLPHPASAGAPVVPSPASTSTPTPEARASSPAPAGFVYGVSVADLKNAPRVEELGFPWMKGHISWQHSEPEQGEYNWADLDKALQAATENHLGLLLRVDQSPGWSHPSNDDPSAPPDPEYLEDWQQFLQLMAARAMGRAQAYEIWNEPNLAIEWGGNPPDPAGYARLLEAAYRAIKRGDPTATVVSAGLANTGEESDGAMNDTVFLERFYQAGGAPYFDVLGYHPHGGPDSPDGEQFLKAEQQRRIMEAHKDGQKPVWATELAWIARPPAECSSDGRWDTRIWESVSADAQAGYLVDSFTLIRSRWPWMQGAFVFNLDFSLAPWYDGCEPMAYESLLDQEGAPRPAFTALQDMPKPSPRIAAGLSFPSGRLVKGSGDDIWLVADGIRRWIPDDETFAAAGYAADEIQTLTDDEVRRIPLDAPLLSVKSGRYPDDMLLKSASSDPVYAVKRGLRRAIPTLGTFDADGYSWLNVRVVSDDELRQIPEGTALPRALQIAYVCEQDDGNEDICIMNADGISQRRLTDDPAADFSPSWKPGEDRIVFVSTRDGSGEIYSMSSDGKEVKRLTKDEGENLAPSYSPDGAQIVFVSDRSGSYQLWTMMGDGSSPAQLADVEGDITWYGWSVDGERIVFGDETADGREKIWMMNADGSDLAPAVDFSMTATGVEPAAGGGPTDMLDVYAVRPSSGATPGPGRGALRASRLPVWPPGGEKVAWMSPDGSGDWSLHVEDGEGNAYAAPIGQAYPDSRLTWSPNGEILALASRADGEWGIYIYTLGDDGPQLTRLTDDAGPVHSPAWSK